MLDNPQTIDVTASLLVASWLVMLLFLSSSDCPCMPYTFRCWHGLAGLNVATAAALSPKCN